MRIEAISRRELLIGRSGTKTVRIRPPGASESTLADCTGCALCAQRCPSGIIRMVEDAPSIDFSRGECTFCGECSAACPEPVFVEKGVDFFPHVAVVADACLAKMNIACQSCGECCPAEAIRFRPRIGGPFIPELNDEICSGCGACLSVCPVGAIGLQARKSEAADA